MYKLTLGYIILKKAAYRGNNGIMLNPSATGLILDLIYM